MLIQDKLDHIHKDISHNVTYIYQRNDLLTTIDLVFHSVLQFYFQGKLLKKGWSEALIIGDTRCGKSETIERLVNHYKSGEISSGENTSFAGLVGGLQQTQKRWSIIWGRVPLNDRKLLAIDEVSGLSYQDIANMSQIRSSGIAEITKIQTERTFARTRLVWLSNPRADTPVAYFNSGVEIVKDLIGKPEDIARFDLVLIMATDEVPKEVINASTREEVPHIYTSALCRNLILWAWSRKADQVVISHDTTQKTLDIAEKLCNKYSSDVPIVTLSEQKVKIIRLAVALAARLFSSDIKGEKVIVNPEHVEYIGEFLDMIYSKPAFAYDIWSKSRRSAITLTNAKLVEARLRAIGKSIIEVLMDMRQIRINDIEEVLGMTREEAKEFISFLVRNRALCKQYTYYIKQPAVIVLLRKLQSEMKDEIMKEEVKDDF